MAGRGSHPSLQAERISNTPVQSTPASVPVLDDDGHKDHQSDVSLDVGRISNEAVFSTPASMPVLDGDNHEGELSDMSFKEGRFTNEPVQSTPVSQFYGQERIQRPSSFPSTSDVSEPASESFTPPGPSGFQGELGLYELPIYQYMRFTFIDINGVPRGKILPTMSAYKYLESGIGCYAGAQAIGPNSEIILPKEVQHRGTMRIIPDRETLRKVSWISTDQASTGQYLCGTYWDKDLPQESCSRSLLKASLDNLQTMDYRLFSGAGVEFTLRDRESMKPIFPESDFLSMLGHTECHAVLAEIERNARFANIGIDAMCCGQQPSQFKFLNSASYGIRGTDDCVILKQSIKEWATAKGWNANFMAKRSPEYSGNGLQFGLSLWRTESETNVFSDKTNDDHLSVFAKRWLAGMLHHASALTALCCPTTNCYKRLHTEWAPHLANWGIDDPRTMLCIKNNQNGTYIVNRLMSGLCNPYLAMAATIAAGLDGVTREMTCPKPHEMETAPILPFTLQQALDSLQNDEVIVNALGKTFVEWFILSKVSSELKDVEDISDEMKLLEIENQKYAKLM